MDNGTAPGGYKFYYHYAATGVHLNIYDDCIEIATGVPRSAPQGQGGQRVRVPFQDITSVYAQAGCLVFTYAPQVPPNYLRSFKYEPRFAQYAQDTVNFILAQQEELRSGGADSAPEEPWPQAQGMAREFTVAGRVFSVSPELDLFNTYRLRFRDAAIRCTDRLAADYQARIRDLDSFLLFYPGLYRKQLDKLIQRALDILLTESIWTEVRDSLLARHLGSFNLGLERYWSAAAGLKLVPPADPRQPAGLPSTPALSCGSLPGSVPGLTPAAALNLVRFDLSASQVSHARAKPQQRMAIYSGINPGEVLFQAYMDYWRTLLTLVSILRESGKAIWAPDAEECRKASNIFQNLNNPNFPQDKLLDTALDVLRADPYSRDLQLFLLNRTGGESKAIADYFGYTNFNDPRLC